MQDLDVINAYLDKFPEQFSCFDALLHDNFYQAGMQNEEYDLTKIFDGTLVQTRPTDAVTIVANHEYVSRVLFADRVDVLNVDPCRFTEQHPTRPDV